MNTRESAFLVELLGPIGAKALLKMAERSPALESALVPRAVLAWLGLVARYDYEGALPGVDNSYVSFTKTESGFEGSIALGADVYGMSQASIYHVAGSVAVALGVEPRLLDPKVKDLDVAKLGKSIDLLAKAQLASKELERKAKEKTKKAEGHGEPAKPMAQAAPIEPELTQPPPAVPKPKVPTLPSLKVTKAEATKACRACGEVQFQGDRFAGCLCFAGLQKSVKTSTKPDGYLLDFGKNWDLEAIEALIASMKK
jgi:hypothetical protein